MTKNILILTAISLFSSLVASASVSVDYLHQKLIILNSGWADRIPDPGIAESLVSTADDEIGLIRTHLKLVIAQLEAVDISHLSEAQRIQRNAHIDTLRQYTNTGRFPKNIYVEGRRPVFIDPWGIHCAVGYLIHTSGRSDLAEVINRDHQLDYLRDIATLGLDEWQKLSGLSFAELELIQPSYEFRNRTQITYPKEIEDLLLGDSSTVKAAVLADNSLISSRCGGKTLIHFAAAAGDLELMKWLVARGADLDAVSKREAEKITLETREGMGRVKTCTISWNAPTTYHEYYHRRMTGRALSSIRGEAIIGVLKDLSGGIDSEGAIYYATAKISPKQGGLSGRPYGGVNIDPALEKLIEDRKEVARWLAEQSSTRPELSAKSDSARL
ncbi:MAG: hypothetical protein P1U89_20610 [Verrucomicrobiales bacterium]|nr:hypothetical protein [Verrucomicrobiales bacterium]